MTKEDFLKQVPTDLSKEDFYNLCKSFIDVALNADKFKTPDGKVAGRFHEDDMHKAASLVRAYLDKYKIESSNLKHFIKLYSHYSISDDDTRQKEYLDKNPHNGSMPAYQAGILYSFTELPSGIIDDIFDIANKLS